MTEISQVNIGMFLTAGIGVLALMLGMTLTRKISFLKKFCIPSPVSGGIIFSLLTFAFYYIAGIEFSFDATIKDICMMIFFASVGFQSDLTAVRKGGRSLGVIVALLAVLITLQNLLPLGIAKIMDVDPLVGLAAGSIPMCGGHGTAGGFSGVLQDMGLQTAPSITMAAATFGLIAGSLLGGPVSQGLIRRHNLCEESHDPVDAGIASFEATNASPEARTEHPVKRETEFQEYTKAVYQLVLTLAAGALLSRVLSLTGIKFPTYFGSLVVAASYRNISELIARKKGRKSGIMLEKIVTLGNICLSMFLGIAMISLKLWDLADLALPLIVMLLSQVAMMFLFTRFVAFPALGKSYDSAVLVSGICGFGLGATPNAMANMSAVCYKYKYTVNPFLIVPIVGAMFVDIINTTIITVFLTAM